MTDTAFQADPVQAGAFTPGGSAPPCGSTGTVASVALDADASRLALRLNTDLRAGHPDAAAAVHAWSYFTNTFTVRAGGLADDSVVRLNFDAGLSGALRVDWPGNLRG